MQKVAGERYVYKFVCDPEALFTMAFPDNTRPLLKSELLKDDTCCGNAGSNSNAHSNMISSRHYPQVHHGGHSPSSGFSSPGSHDSRDQPLALTVGAIVPGEGGHNNQHLNGGSHLNDFRSAAAASSVNPLSHQDMCSHPPILHHHNQVAHGVLHGEHSPPSAHMHNLDLHTHPCTPEQTLLHSTLSPNNYPPNSFTAVHHDMAARMYPTAGPFNMEGCVY